MMRFLQLLILLAIPLVVMAEPVHLKIGATLPLTGGLAMSGNDIRQGLELGLQEFLSDKVVMEVFYDDNQHDAKQAISSARRLIEDKKVDILISLWDMADVIAPITEQRRIPHLAIRWNPEIGERFKYTFTVESTYLSYVDSLFEFLKATQVKTVALMTEEGVGWVLADQYFRQRAREHGVDILAADRINSSAGDFRSALLRLTRTRPDLLLLFTNPPNTQMLIKQIREMAPRQKFTGYFQILDDLGPVEDVPFVAQFQVADWFVSKFAQRFGSAPRSRAAQVYDIMHILSRAAEKSQAKPVPESILETVALPEFREGAVGPLKITQAKAIESQCAWQVVKDGKIVKWTPK